MASTKGDKDNQEESTVSCPICNKMYEKAVIEEHVNKCLFLNSSEETKLKQNKVDQLNSKRNNSHLNNSYFQEKRPRISTSPGSSKTEKSSLVEPSKKTQLKESKSIPLAERMRPLHLEDIIGQVQVFGPGSMLRSSIENKIIPNMILWGPPGCGKTSLANVIANICKEQNNLRFVKLSATMAGINDVKEVVKIAKNEAQFKRQTVLFMDEIHRFNKLQQDTFLPHVETGTIILIGATTENPSFSLNNALLSRCRVVVMEKLSADDVLKILKHALMKTGKAVIGNGKQDLGKTSCEPPQCIVEEASLKWLAEMCDGDARVALGALELALAARAPEAARSEPAILRLEDIIDGIKRSHMVYDRKGEEHYNTVSAIHKSIRASDDNAALYWTTRALHGGEDPLYIARRLVRAACEDIGLADQSAIVEAVACLQGCQQLGMPECDVLLAQCAVRLARAPKSTEVYRAMKRCRKSLIEAKGPLPPVPLHLRNAPTKLMKQLGYARGYNMLHKDKSGLNYMPEGMESRDFFQDSDSSNE
ncbi:ATPase WRNIP1-like isoform X1 [Spodoptera litura]|uniref:ATPase WRNIP1-like isoform X1 n=2 Tax=Spodoptera litura TaxID=69820 RepID=A0A9J7E199_SPOLT|nr:ATPase WRNIP1-like isoform X1 [Spodoptera litura]XP_022820356.1 ATPase WRNIP1-like isoform X1 [Spodoptera litura]